jgi:hypothetical protein
MTLLLTGLTKDWRVKGEENAVTGYWLYRETKEPWLSNY